MNNNSDMTFNLTLWVLCAGFMVWMKWRQKIPSSGLLMGYVFSLAALYWLGAFLYTLPWYNVTFADRVVVEKGLQLSVYGISAACVGSVFVAPFITQFLLAGEKLAPTHIPEPRLPK